MGLLQGISSSKGIGSERDSHPSKSSEKMKIFTVSIVVCYISSVSACGGSHGQCIHGRSSDDLVESPLYSHDQEVQQSFSDISDLLKGRAPFDHCEHCKAMLENIHVNGLPSEEEIDALVEDAGNALPADVTDSLPS